MNAGDIIKQLLKLGTVIHDAYTKAQTGGGSVDWSTFFGSADFKRIEQTVKDLANQLKPSDIGPAIAELDRKQTALLNGRQLQDLSTAELGDYSVLSRSRLLLATSNLEAALKPQFWQWVADEALPVLMDLAPVVLTLLL